MRKLRYLAKLVVPTLVLAFLGFYADYIDETGQVPLSMKMVIGLLLGYFLYRGGWRWVILLGIGYELSQLTGHLIDSSDVPAEFKLTITKLLWGLLPAAIAVYSGIFARRYFLGIPDSDEDIQKQQLHNIERDLQALALASEARKKLGITPNKIQPVTKKTATLKPKIAPKQKSDEIDENPQDFGSKLLPLTEESLYLAPDLPVRQVALAVRRDGQYEEVGIETDSMPNLFQNPESEELQRRAEALKRLESRLGLK